MQHSTNLKAINEISHQISLKSGGEIKKGDPFKYSYPFKKSKKKFSTKLDNIKKKGIIEGENQDENQILKNESTSSSTNKEI